MLGLYLHIPFCAAICHYCNFNRGLLDEAVKGRYVDALVGEIGRAAEPATPVDTIFFGGGTPSLLSGVEVDRVLTACRSAFAVTADAEITLEANPETLTPALLDSYHAAGVNRLSVGVQSFDPADLARLGRVHSVETAERAVPMARAAGFENVSLDLMLWLPEQRHAGAMRSIDRLIEISPDHASIYLLELYPNAPLREHAAREHWSQSPDDEAADMYEAAIDRLSAAGYEQYEISNVARPRKQSRHNLKYWQDGEWLGFGCGAHATREGRRWRNVAGTGDYVARIAAGASVVAECRRLSSDDRLAEALMTGLRLNAGVQLPAMEARYGVDVWARFGEELAPFIDAGLLLHAPGERLALSRAGMLLSNEVAAVFIGSTVR